MNQEDFKIKAEQHARVKPVTLAYLEQTVKKYKTIIDPYVLKILVAMVIANKLPGKRPIWMFLVGPSAGGKTMFLDMMTGMDEIYPLSNLTPNTFVSGQKNVQGLLFKINNKILTFKDFTTILKLNQDSRNEIMSQLREIYDGSYKKVYGTGEEKDWKGKIGFLAGVTTVIDMNSQMESALGERFIMYRHVTADREEVAMKGLDALSRNEEEQKEEDIEMQVAFEGCVRKVESVMRDTERYQLPYDLKKRLASLASFATLARSPIIREFGFTKEFIYKPSSEMATRLVQQIGQLAIAIAYINKASDAALALPEADEKLLAAIALDSISGTRRTMLQKLTALGEAKTSVISMETDYPPSATKRHLEDLTSLGIVTKRKEGNLYLWKMKDKFASLIKTYDDVKELSTEERAELEVKASATDGSAEDEAFMSA